MTPSQGPRRLSGIMSYPLLDFFTPLGVRCLLPNSFTPLGVRDIDLWRAYEL